MKTKTKKSIKSIKKRKPNMQIIDNIIQDEYPLLEKELKEIEEEIEEKENSIQEEENSIQEELKEKDVNKYIKEIEQERFIEEKKGFRKLLDNDGFLAGLLLTFVLYGFILFNHAVGISNIINLGLTMLIIVFVLAITTLPRIINNYDSYDITRSNIHNTVWYTVFFSGGVLALFNLNSLIKINWLSVLALFLFSFIIMEFYINFIAKKGNYNLWQVAWLKLKGLIFGLFVILNILLIRKMILDLGWNKVLIITFTIIKLLAVILLGIALILLAILLIALFLKLNQESLRKGAPEFEEANQPDNIKIEKQEEKKENNEEWY